MISAAAHSLALAIGLSSLVTVYCERLRFPALLPLLVIGLGLGSSGLGVVDARSMGDFLKAFITVAIGLLIFEGTLHLNKEELMRAPGAVRGLLTVGALATWAGSAACAHYILGFSIPASLLLGAALIVTGPTVVQPILRRLRVTPALHAALGAEAVFIDPLGVVATVATLEIVRSLALTGESTELWIHAFWLYTKPIVGGALVGVVVGILGLWGLRRAARHRRMETKRLNLYFVGVCMTAVGAGEYVSPEAGLGAVTIAGLILAQVKVIGATELRAFKEQLAAILVGTLFVLLASRFEARQLRSVGPPELLFVAALVLVVRPLSVFLATFGSKLSHAERAFAALFAPRGIVALSVAAIAAAELREVAGPDGQVDPGAPSWLANIAAEGSRLELVMFLTIAVTVFMGTAVSPLIARILGVRAGQASGVVLIGGNPLAISLAKLLKSLCVHVRVVDANPLRVAAAKAVGVEAFQGDATDARWLDDVVNTPEMGWLIAWTGNDTVDRVAARWGEERFGSGSAGIWSAGAVKPDWANMELGGGRLLADAIDGVESGSLEVRAEQGTAAKESTAFACIEDGRFRLLPKGAQRNGEEVKLITLAPVSSTPGAKLANSDVVANGERL